MKGFPDKKSYNSEYYSTKNSVDKNNLEAMFLYINNYRQFKDFSLNLNAKYIFHYKQKSNILTIKNNPNFIKGLYPENINLKILCGENGTGKTSIIKLLQNIEAYKDCFIVYKNNKGEFYTNKENLKIKYDGRIVECNVNNHSTRSIYFNFEGDSYIICPNEDISQDKFCKEYLSNYSKYNILGSKYEHFFNHFSIEYYNLSRNCKELGSSLQIKYEILINSIDDLKGCFRRSPIKCILLLNILDLQVINSTIQQVKKNKKFKIEDDIIDYLIKILYNDHYNKICKIEGEFKSFIYTPSENNTNKNKCIEILDIINIPKLEPIEFSLSKYGYIKKQFKNFTKMLNKYNTLYNYPKIKLNDYFYCNLFKKTESGNIHFNNLSSGEQRKLIITMNIFNKIFHANDLARTLIFEDDVDAYLHPEWCRTYIHNYIYAVKRFSKKITKTKSKIYNIIMTTHSPFLLSDTTNEHVEYLRRNKNGYVTLRPKQKIQNTLCGNILQMFADNFFLDTTIGDYGKMLLKEVLAYQKGISLNRPKFVKNEWSRQEKDAFCEKVLNALGDPLLKSLFKSINKERNCNAKT